MSPSTSPYNHGNDSLSHLNASTTSLQMPISSTISRSSSSIDELKRGSANTPTNGNQSMKPKAWVVATYVLGIFSVLNFISETSFVKQTRNLNEAFVFASAVQEDYAHENLDLTLIDEMGILKDEATQNHNRNLQNLQRAEPRDNGFVPLYKLIPPKIPKTCPEGFQPAPIVVNPTADKAEGRKIPKIVHMTGKSPCLTPPFYDACLKWSFPGHSFYFHDDQAVDELFNRDWPMFPQLKNTLECLKNAGGAAKADLWRYLALWEYGGIYTDMDNLPGEYFNETTITNDTDAFFLQERGGWVSQYFFAVAPKHPVMFLAVHDVMREMHNLEDTGNFYVPAKTGPGATKRAFLFFMGIDTRSSEQDVKFYSKPPAGLYHGKINGNRTVTVEGSRSMSGKWVARSAIGGGAKRNGFKAMNISNYQELNKKESGRSCVMQLHDYYMHEQQDEISNTLRRRRW